MKKLLALFLVVGILGAFCGCSKSAKIGDSSAASNTTSTAEGTDNFPKVENVSDQITLGKYKDVSVDWSTQSNAQALDNALSQYTTTKEVTDRPVKNGDTVNIDYAGYKDGVAFEGGTAQGHDLVIGSHSFIDGFEEGLIGAKKGEKRDLNLTFPKEYHSADLAGAKVVFKVTVNKITEKVTTEEDTKKAKESIWSDVLFSSIIEGAKVKELPTDLVNYYVNRFTQNYTAQATSGGYESLEAYYTASGLTKEDFEKLLKNNSEYSAKRYLVALAIAEKEKITLSDSEYSEKVTEYAETNSQTTSEFETANGKNFIKSELLIEKVCEYLADKSTCK